MNIRCKLSFHAFKKVDAFGRTFCARPGCETRKPVVFPKNLDPEYVKHNKTRKRKRRLIG